MTSTRTTASGLPARLWSHCHATASRDGLLAAFQVLYDGMCMGALPFGPAGHALVPSVIARDATRAWVDAQVTDRAAGQERTLASHRLGPAGLIALKHSGTVSPHRAAAPYRAWVFGLVWLRLGLSERLLDACRVYLGARRISTTPLLHQQMVKGALADAVIGQLEVRATIEGSQPDDPALTHEVVTDLHGRVTATDRILVKLLGAGGFVVDGPGHTAYLSELLADVYTSRPRAKERE